MAISTIGLALVLAGCQTNQPTPIVEETPANVVEEVIEEDATLPHYQAVLPAEDPENATYIIDGQPVALIDGESQVPLGPDPELVSTITMFGQPTMGDLTADNVDDAAVVLVVTGSGSGTFYYQAAALNKDGMYSGTNAILLGDRIAPQNTQIMEGTIIANFAERAPGEPMTAQPSVGVSKYMQVQGGILVEVDAP